jgi:thiosulfate/3-mercaptopyruvate sulfurtransferase
MNAVVEAPTIYIGVAMLLLLLGAVMPASSMQRHLRPEMVVTTTWLQEHLGHGDLVVVFVGRSRATFEAGHIPGAHFLPLEGLVEQHPQSLNDLPPVAVLQETFEKVGAGDTSTIVLYGEAGGLLATRAYFTLDYLGHADRIVLLDGGLEKWVAESRPVEQGHRSNVRAHFTPHVNSEILITTQRMHDITAGASASEYLLLDARPPGEFSGSVKSEGVPKAGHLPEASSLYWRTLLQPDNSSSLLDVPQLQTALARAGADPNKVIVSYCRTGMQSSFTYFVAKYLGYRAAMYDGSVYEWVNGAGYDLQKSPAAIATGP